MTRGEKFENAMRNASMMATFVNLGMIAFGMMHMQGFHTDKKEASDPDREDVADNIERMNASIASIGKKVESFATRQKLWQSTSMLQAHPHARLIDAGDVWRCYRILAEMEFRRHHLSENEKDVARCLMRHHTNEGICKKLFLSATKVKQHIKSIYKKTGCNSRGRFVRIIQTGIANSDYIWRDRVDLERDIERFGID